MSTQFKKRSAPKSLRPKNDDSDEEGATQVIKANPTLLCKPISVQSGRKESTSETPTGSAATTIFDSTREIKPVEFAGGATHTTEIDTATDRDARAVLERSIRLQEDGSLEAEGNVYHGQSGYKQFIKKDMAQVGNNKMSGTQGPIRAPAFLRSSIRMDYQPDICKDYKETGFCGYGDQCKFLHDRGDYKSGWQLEREWDAMQLKKKKKLESAAAKLIADEEGEEAGEGGGDVDEEENFEIEDDEELPFACFICREPFTNPVVTLCGHYFCSDCIIAATKKRAYCPACDKQTFGVFNRPHKLLKKIQQASGTESISDKKSVPVVQARPRFGEWEVSEDATNTKI